MDKRHTQKSDIAEFRKVSRECDFVFLFGFICHVISEYYNLWSKSIRDQLKILFRKIWEEQGLIKPF